MNVGPQTADIRLLMFTDTLQIFAFSSFTQRSQKASIVNGAIQVSLCDRDFMITYKCEYMYIQKQTNYRKYIQRELTF